MSSKKKILIVDDEPAVLKIIAKKISEANFEPLLAENGVSGLESALSNHPDLILLDIIMPTMDGVEMLKQLRDDKWGKKVKVLVLTNLGDAEKTEEALALGADSYLVKANWKIDDLMQRVKEEIKQQSK